LLVLGRGVKARSNKNCSGEGKSAHEMFLPIRGRR
jgi:hypothetical protein